MNYRYFVAFSFKAHDGVSGLGNCEITRPAPIEGPSSVRAIERDIARRGGYESVIIINWRLFDALPDAAGCTCG